MPTVQHYTQHLATGRHAHEYSVSSLTPAEFSGD